MYFFTFPIDIFIQYTFLLQPPLLSTLHSPSSLTFFHLSREWGPLEYAPNMTSHVNTVNTVNTVTYVTFAVLESVS